MVDLDLSVDRDERRVVHDVTIIVFLSWKLS